MASREGRTEEATPKRRQEARQKGQIARSADLVGWSMILVLSYLLPMTAASVAKVSRNAWARALGSGDDVNAAPVLLGASLREGFLAVLPFLGVAMALAVLTNLAQVGFLFSGKTLKPNWKAISPAAGFKRIYGPRAAWETVKQILKSAVIVLATWPMLTSIPERYLARGGQPLHRSLPMALADVMSAIRFSSYAMLGIAAADYLYQRQQTRKDMRMTVQEVRYEMKDAEGDPLLKARQRSLQRQMSTNNMLSAVADAQVVVTNPTHLAVALAYDAEMSAAPKVVASGADALAAKIREAAAAAGVPIVEAKPLARALYKVCAVGDEIPFTLYDAVARVLAFIRRLNPMLLGPDPIELPAMFTSEVPDLPKRKRRS